MQKFEARILKPKGYVTEETLLSWIFSHTNTQIRLKVIAAFPNTKSIAVGESYRYRYNKGKLTKYSIAKLFFCFGIEKRYIIKYTFLDQKAYAKRIKDNYKAEKEKLINKNK